LVPSEKALRSFGQLPRNWLRNPLIAGDLEFCQYRTMARSSPSPPFRMGEVALVKWLILKKQGRVDAASVSVVFTFVRTANLIPAMYPLRPIRPIRPILPLFSGRRRPRPNGPYSLIAQPNGLGGAAPESGGPARRGPRQRAFPVDYQKVAIE
jgi:hypothetical protein